MLVIILLLGPVTLAGASCAFRSKESQTYYQGSFPQYKQAPDGRYYPVDQSGKFAAMDYSYRPDLKGYAVIVPGQQQGGATAPRQMAQQPQQPQAGQRPGAYAPPQQGQWTGYPQQPQPYPYPQQAYPQQAYPQQPYPQGYAPPQGAAGVPPQGPNYGNMVQPGAAAPAPQAAPMYAPPPHYVQQQPYPAPQQPYAQPGYAPPQGYAAPAAPAYARVPQLPTGYYGDNDEDYQMVISREQIDREAMEKQAGQVPLPPNMVPSRPAQAYQPVPQPQVPQQVQAYQPAPQPAQRATPRLPDLNQIYSQFPPADIDESYKLPPNYSQPDIDNYNSFYAN